MKGGIFSDVAHDDFAVHNTLSTGLYRLRVPSWDNAKFAAPCEFNCPTGIPTQRRYDLIRQGKLDEALQLELDYTPFAGSVCGSVCPNPCMDHCTRGTIDEPIQIGDLGYRSAFVPVAPPKEKTGRKSASSAAASPAFRRPGSWPARDMTSRFMTMRSTSAASWNRLSRAAVCRTSCWKQSSSASRASA